MELLSIIRNILYIHLHEKRDNKERWHGAEIQEYLFKEAMLTARRCQECGQTLPPTYQLLADEDWSTGIFGCTEDTDSFKCLTGLFCPCVLFGRNVENLNADISERAACVGHIICVEGGMTFAALTTVLNGIDPQTLFLIYEGLFFAWWMCGIYTSMARQSLQKKYHLKVI
ncbi:cell number regulator 6-like [Camellia sinensis]|uniref:cell number regulator 6-like n=1 Tax=Camellia sinensis TaxID=4442 RepID=UPI001036AA22|nr:cell number regulator 6-like [Camellia sinensis]